MEWTGSVTCEKALARPLPHFLQQVAGRHDIQFSLVDHLDGDQLPGVDLARQFHHSEVPPAQGPAQVVQPPEVCAPGAAAGLSVPALGSPRFSRRVHVYETRLLGTVHVAEQEVEVPGPSALESCLGGQRKDKVPPTWT